MKDFCGQELKIGDRVIAVEKCYGNGHLRFGTVTNLDRKDGRISVKRLDSYGSISPLPSSVYKMTPTGRVSGV